MRSRRLIGRGGETRFVDAAPAVRPRKPTPGRPRPAARRHEDRLPANQRAARGGAEGAAGAAPDKGPGMGSAPPGSAVQGTEIAASRAPGGAFLRSQGGTGRSQDRPTGWSRRPSTGGLANPRVCRRSAPLFGSAMRMRDCGVPGADQRIRAMSHAFPSSSSVTSLRIGRWQRRTAPAPGTHVDKSCGQPPPRPPKPLR